MSTTEKADERLGPLGRLTSESLSLMLALIAAARRGKAVHPEGVVYAAELEISGAADAPRARLLSEPANHRAIIRFSRSIAWPRPLPDLLGMAIRVLDAYGPDRHQDLMLISSMDRPIMHHAFIPARDVWQRPYSSALPYRAGGESFLIGALPRLEPPRPRGRTEFERLQAAAQGGRLSFQLAVSPLAGRFHPIGALRLGDRISDDLDALRFNPWNTGDDLQPSTWLNAARYQSYRRSQTAWGLTRSHGRERQQLADQELAKLRPEPPRTPPAPRR